MGETRGGSYTRREAMKLGALGAAGLAGYASATTTSRAAAQGAWARKAALPAAQSAAGGGVVNDRLYVYGGIRDGSGLRAVPWTYVYNAGTDRWQKLADMPAALWGNCGVSAAGKLFSFGGAPAYAPYNGTPPTDSVFVYRPGGGWTNLTATKGVRCPYPNWAMSGLYNPTDGLIYCVGGGTNVTSRSSATAHGVRNSNPGRFDESRIWTFDPVAERVVGSDLARMPVAKRWPSVALATVSGKPYVYAVGGYLGVLGPTSSNFRFDPATRRWEVMRPAPRAGYYATRNDPVIDNEVYLTHGLFGTTNAGYLLVCHRYDPESNAFETSLPAPSVRRASATDGVIGGTLYVAGGHVKPDSFHDCTAANEALTP